MNARINIGHLSVAAVAIVLASLTPVYAQAQESSASALPFQLKPHHVGIFVSDLDRSIDWYADVLGFELMEMRTLNVGGNPEGVVFAWLKQSDFYVELREAEHFDGSRVQFTARGVGGTDHLSFYVEPAEWEGLVRHLRSKGVNFLIEHRWPEELFNVPGGIGVVYIADPDGIPIEIQETFRPGEH